MPKNKYDVMKVFSSVDDEEFSIDLWNELTDKLLKLNGRPHKRRVNLSGNEENVVSGYQYINSDYKNVELENRVFRIEFNNFYPQITDKIIKNIEFNYRGYSLVWKKVFEAYKELDPSFDSYNTLKKWINWSFGAINNEKTDIRTRVYYQNLIKKRANHVLDEVRTAFEPYVVLIDTDLLFVVGWAQHSDLQEFVRQYGYEFDVTPIETFIPLDERKYVGVEDGEFFSHGVKNTSQSKTELLELF